MRIRQHVNPLGLHYEQFKGVRPPFEPGRLLEVEIGCAEAQFLFERATQDPSRTYVGLEIRDELVDHVNRLARERGAPVHAVFCQAQLHMAEIFGDVKASRIYVNFPDPWFKRKHHARRMVDATLAEGIARLLAPDGELFVQTDVWDIALDALASFEPRFENVAGEWTFWKDGNPYGVRSWREQNAEETGLTIWRLRYRAPR